MVQSMIGTFESSGQMPGFLDAAWVSCSAGEAGGDSPGDGRTQETLEAGGNFTADWVSFGAPRSWLTQDVLYHFFLKSKCVFLKIGYLFYLFLFWLCWVFITARGLSLVVSGGYSLAAVHGLLIVATSLVGEHGL